MLYDDCMNNQPQSMKQPATKPYHHGDLQQEILSAARLLLEETSIAALSLRAVAKKVGVSHTAPYRHFKDKESLLAGIAAISFDELAVKMSEAVALHPEDPTAQIKEAGYCYFNMVMVHPQSVQLMFGDFLPCDDTYPGLRESGDLAFDSLKSLVEYGQSMGVFKHDDVELMALTFWSCIHGLSLLVAGRHVEATVPSATDHRILIDTVTSLMLKGMKS